MSKQCYVPNTSKYHKYDSLRFCILSRTAGHIAAKLNKGQIYQRGEGRGEGEVEVVLEGEREREGGQGEGQGNRKGETWPTAELVAFVHDTRSTTDGDTLSNIA